MRKQIHIFLTAVMFYTRIPCPSWVDHSEELLNKATIYFPLIGWIVGGFAALFYALFAQILPNEVAVLLSMASSIWLTGAFHEDGFGDACDGFGGGWTKEKILTIMKDSRIGAYGTIGLILILGLKFSSLKNFVANDAVWAMLAAHPLSRWLSVCLIFTMDYARENDADGKAKPVAKKLSPNEFLTATIFGITPLSIWAILTEKFWLFGVFLPLFLLAFYLKNYFQKWIGGYTGDCLGATQQAAEVVLYLFFLLKY